MHFNPFLALVYWKLRLSNIYSNILVFVVLFVKPAQSSIKVQQSLLSPSFLWPGILHQKVLYMFCFVLLWHASTSGLENINSWLLHDTFFNVCSKMRLFKKASTFFFLFNISDSESLAQREMSVKFSGFHF